MSTAANTVTLPNLEFTRKALQMSENNDLYGIGKYDSRRDEILHALCVADWSNASFGDVEAPGGYVWRIDLDKQDIFGTVSGRNTEFESLLDALEFYDVTISERRALIGHFIVIEDSNGFIYVRSFDTEGDLMHEYEYRELQYSEWLGEDDD